MMGRFARIASAVFSLKGEYGVFVFGGESGA